MAASRRLLVAVSLLSLGSALAFALGADPAPRAPLLFPLPIDHLSGLRDSFKDKRGGRIHEAVDIMAPRDTPVLAVADGRVAKLFLSVPGGKTIYQFDTAESVAYYYAHLDRYAEGLAEGAEVKRGDVIGFVGNTGNASNGAPHLHFAIFKLGPERQWWKGEPIDPYPLLTGTPR